MDLILSSSIYLLYTGSLFKYGYEVYTHPSPVLVGTFRFIGIKHIGLHTHAIHSTWRPYLYIMDSLR
jgi:hypothetical protein